jgi:hypothetical protein
MARGKSMRETVAVGVGILAMLSLVCAACSYETRLLSPPLPTHNIATAMSEPLHVLVIDDVEFTRNGKPDNVDVGLVQRLASDLRKSGLFRVVYEPTTSYDAPKEAVRVKLAVRDEFDKQWGEVIAKDFLVGLSYLVLAPVMPYEMEYTVSMHATVVLPDESTMEFESSSQTEVKYKHLSDRSAAAEDLKRTGLNHCVERLLTQMQSDEKFRMALQPQ